MPAEPLSAKGRQTRQALEQAARKLFAIATLSRIWKKTLYGF
jgi:hypothetical protein